MTDATLETLLAHAGFVRAIAREIATNEHDVDDLVQETWRAALERPPRRGGSIRAWLATVTRNFGRRRGRELTRRQSREHAAARNERLPAADAVVERDEIVRRVVDVVLALAEPYRSTILMRFYENLRPAEIATRTGVSVDTVHTRIRRALLQMRGRLDSDPRGRATLLALGAWLDQPAILSGPFITLGLVMKTKLAVVAAVLAVLSVGVFVVLRSQPTAETAVAASEEGVRSEASTVAADAREPGERASVPMVQRSWSVSGRVVDTDGVPFEHVRVCVVGDEDPFGAPASNSIGVDDWKGRTFETDADGRFVAELPGPGRVLVMPGMGVKIGARFDFAKVRRWVDPPAAGVDFVLQRLPMAHIEIRAEFAGSRTPLTNFMAAADGRGSSNAFYSRGADDLVVSFDVTACNSPAMYKVSVLRQKGEDPVSAEVLVTPDARVEVVLVIPSAGITSGYVVDRDGRSIEDALVFSGDETDARGDEPFRPFDVKRVPSGVRTAADGWFTLEGDGPLITAWHPRFSGATVARAEAGRIVLTPHASLRGRLVDASGAPAAERRIVFGDAKHGRELTTQADGRFAVDDVEAGTHGVWLDRKSLIAGVRLEAGEQAEIELELPAESGHFEVELAQRDSVSHAPLKGILVGLDRVCGVYECNPAKDRGKASAASALWNVDTPVRRGRYLLATRDGCVAELSVESERALVELGVARLIVRAKPGRRFHAVPASTDRFARLMVARCPVQVPDNGEVEFALQPGRYALIGDAGLVLAEVDVPPSGATYELR